MSPQATTTETKYIPGPTFKWIEDSLEHQLNRQISNIISFSLAATLMMLILFVDKASHIILHNIKSQDLASSTFLIVMYCLFCSFIATVQTTMYNRHQLVRGANYIISNYLLIHWSLILLVNFGIVNLLSIKLTSTFLILCGLYVSYRLFKNRASKEEIEKKRFNRYSLIRVLFLAFVLILTYQICIYSSYKYDDLYNFLAPTFAEVSKQQTTMKFISLGFMIFVLLKIFRRQMLLKISEFISTLLLTKFQFTWIERWTIKPLVSKIVYIVGSLLALASLLLIGVNRSFDIVLAFIILLRVIFFLTGLVLFSLYHHILKLFTQRRMGNTAILCLVSASLLTTSCQEKDQYKKVYQYAAPSSSAATNPPSFSHGIEDWFDSQQLSPNDTIFIVNGQGGGSRAGCTFYLAMSMIDSIYKKPILNMSTISGSSNGAGFFLGVQKIKKENNYSGGSRISSAMTLYNHDYISTAVFKTLYATLMGPTTNRNTWLMDEERRRLDAITTDPSLSLNYLNQSWNQATSDPLATIFTPVSFNISTAQKAVFSPFTYDLSDSINTFSILENNGFPQLTMAHGVSLSEMFPVISASAIVGDHNYMDGGVYDNVAYETTDAIYKQAVRVRDRSHPTIKIHVITILNSPIEVKDTVFGTYTAALEAGSRALFSSNVIANRLQLKKSVSKNTQDRHVEVTAYAKNIPNSESSIFSNLLRIDTSSNNVVMSRYLDPNNIYQIHAYVKNAVDTMYNSYRSTATTSNEIAVYFDFNDSELTASEHIKLERSLPAKYPESLEIEIYCDSRDRGLVNDQLCKQRWHAVHDVIKSAYSSYNSRPLTYKSSVCRTPTEKDILDRYKERKAIIKY